jgi:hypothetical protein
MELDTKIYSLTDRQSQCDCDFDSKMSDQMRREIESGQIGASRRSDQNWESPVRFE